MIIRTCSGVLRSSTDDTMQLTQPLLPDPVVPAMSRWGSLVRSAYTALPEMSLPNHTMSGPADLGNSW